MYACPWCERGRFSFWGNLKCGTCKRPVSVNWTRAQIAAIPALALGFLGLIAGKMLYMTWPAVFLGGWIGITLGMLLTAPLYHFYVPLVKPDEEY